MNESLSKIVPKTQGENLNSKVGLDRVLLVQKVACVVVGFTPICCFFLDVQFRVELGTSTAFLISASLRVTFAPINFN